MTRTHATTPTYDETTRILARSARAGDEDAARRLAARAQRQGGVACPRCGEVTSDPDADPAHRLQAEVVGVPSRSWRWARRAEVRVYRACQDPRGRGYRDRCEDVYEDYDARYTGPRSALGRLLRELAESGVRS